MSSKPHKFLQSADGKFYCERGCGLHSLNVPVAEGECKNFPVQVLMHPPKVAFTKAEKKAHKVKLNSEADAVISLLGSRKKVGQDFFKEMMSAMEGVSLKGILKVMNNTQFAVDGRISDYADTRFDSRPIIRVNPALLHFGTAKVVLRWTLIHELSHAIRLYCYHKKPARGQSPKQDTPTKNSASEVAMTYYGYDKTKGEMGLYLQEKFLGGITGWDEVNGAFLRKFPSRDIVPLPKNGYDLVGVVSVKAKRKICVVGRAELGKCGRARKRGKSQ
eukprot:g4666.t1